MHSRGKGPLLSLVCVLLLNGIHGALSEEPESLILGSGLDEVAEDGDGRKWSPDKKFLETKGDSITAKASYQDPSLMSQIPYMSARVFKSESTYKFPIKSDKRYWLRLHFYPSLYDTFDPTNSYFSVTANGVTLLTNFSASVTCEALSLAYIDREYSLAPLNSDSLTLTFQPSDKYDGAFAFVNGIQLIEMPDLFDSASLIGYDDQTIDVKTLNLQTMFRLNVGGQFISPIHDSGLTRIWYDDTPYLYGSASGVTNKAEKNVTINYQTMPEHIAPHDVYSTSRSMGGDPNINMGYNLTWSFRVDPSSMYLVRLHFCDYHYSKINQIVFNIFVNNQTAQAQADVIGWTGGIGVPIYKDYVIHVEDGKSNELLWLALHPDPDTRPEFYDAILNGVEIFKLNDTDLSAPNPLISDMLLREHREEEAGFFTHKSSHRSVIGGAAGGAAGFAFMAVVCVAMYNKKKREPGSDGQTGWLPIYSRSSKCSKSGRSMCSTTLSAMSQGLCRYFTLQEIKQATDNFDESNVIGVGGFGKVYKGVIDNGTKVAIKRSNPQSEQGVDEFQTEIEMLSKLRHKHLVSLIGFCEENDEMCLVYDYMALGTMREHLYKGNKPMSTLSWKQRLEICIGAAKGLHYLHTGAKYTIIHRDVKTTNILLDENWNAKVSDFGLSKTGPNMDQGHVSTVVKGSFGYLDPEYFRRQQLTEKSDVYSFGVVLFEALCARPVLIPNLPKEQVSLAEWALICKKKGTLEDIIDPCLKGNINEESLNKFVDTAEKCLSDHGTDRPSMNDLLWNLEFALNLQENVNGEGGSTQSAQAEKSEFEDISLENDIARHYRNLSLGSDIDINDNSTENQDAIFSQIVSPKGR
ncbi:unnamed protein product [Sphenostylis stenocarpa]|uniref:non-specific serine/threonine protein kinase n=1 Tax=Sphenostylis stenocarpa TaxID=92480 RepID=A0AA86VFS8_9FABA|nr:unnamed protein product [Sphenostylis stenocarpa]